MKRSSWRLLNLILAVALAMSVYSPLVRNAEASEGTASLEQPELMLVVFGKDYAFLYGTPYIMDGRTLVPVRDLLVALGIPNDEKSIRYDDRTRTVTAIKDDVTLQLQVGATTLMKNGEPYAALDVPAQLKDSRVYLPARAIAEALGYRVFYDADLNAVVINKGQTKSQEVLDDELFEAALQADLPKVLSLLFCGANPNAVRDRESLLITVMVEEEFTPETTHEVIAHTLILHGADVNTVSEYNGDTPLRLAVAENLYNLAVLLLEKGADPNAVSNPATSYADSIVMQLGSIGFRGSGAERAKMLQLLQSYGADLNYSDKYNNTLLSNLIYSHTWYDRRYAETIQTAIRLGAQDGILAVLELDEEERIPILQLMLAAGLDINASYDGEPNTQDKTLLEVAVEQQLELKTILQLLELGADPTRDQTISFVQQALSNATAEQKSYYDDVIHMLEDYSQPTGGLFYPATDVTVSGEFVEEEIALFPVIKEGRYGYIDRNGELVVEPQYLLASEFNEGLAVVRGDNQLAGYINEHGEVVIEPIYEDAKVFREGLAPVAVEYGSPLHFINSAGETVFETDYIITSGFNEGLAAVVVISDPFYMNGNIEFIDSTGKTVLRLEDRYDVFSSIFFNDGYTLVKRAEGYSYIDKSGDPAFGAIFPDARHFSEGAAGVGIIGEYGIRQYGFIDQSGDMLVEPKFFDAGSFSEGLAPVKSVLGQWGFTDKEGRLAIPMQYDQVSHFAEGLAAARQGVLWGFIDKQGRWVIEPQFESIETFRGGLARYYVDDPDGGGPDLIGYINREGHIVWEAGN